MPATITKDDLSFFALGVVPNTPGQDRTALWSAMFFGGRREGTVTLRFAEEPEDRVIETLLAHFGATSVTITPPARLTEEA